VWGWDSHSQKWELGVATPLWQSVRMKLTLPKLGTWSPPGLPKIQSLIVGVKTPRIGVFLISLERSWSVDVQNGLVWVIRTSIAQVMGQRRVENRPNLDVRWRSATWRWKDLEESYKIDSELVPIGGRGEKLWWPKVPGVQIGTVSRLHFGSPGTKSHLGVGAVEQHREYYMGEGGGFPRVRAVVSQVNPKSPVACPNTKRVQNEF
jgi:hypothetical protein